MRNQLFGAVSALAVLAGLSPAQATLMVSANVDGNIFSCADQAGCDTNPLVGQLVIADQTFGGVQFLGASATSTHVGIQSINTASFQFNNLTAATVPITVAVGDTSYIGPVSLLDLSGGGTFQSAVGSSITLTYFADTADAQGATTPTTLPGTLLATDNATATLVTDSFSFNHPATAFADPNLYSMTLGTVVDLVAGGSVVGRTQAIVAQPEAVSEPGSLALLGAGLVGMGLMIRRRQKRDTGSYAIA